MKMVFAGTPAFAVPALRAAAKQFDVAAVLTQPDRPQGRKRVLTPSPVKQAALELGIPVLQPERLRTELGPLRAVGADLMVTCAYGQILTQETLDLFPLGVWNVHASLLPKYRGAAPIAAAILAGERETGVTIMRTDIGLDTGDMFLKETLPIAEDDTCGTLTEKLSQLGAELLIKALERIKSGDISLEKQGEGTLCRKTVRTQIDFDRPASEVSALVRALSPAPLAYAKAGEFLLNCYNACEADGFAAAPAGTVLAASAKTGLVVSCAQGAVRLTEVQPSGGKRMTDTAFCNGGKCREGDVFDKPVL